MIRGTGGNTTAPSAASASMEPVRTAGKDGPDAVSDARRLVVGLSWAAAAWGLAYAAYRGYSALGGTGFLPGTPVPGGPFRRINAAAAGILLVAAILPVAAAVVAPPVAAAAARGLLARGGARLRTRPHRGHPNEC